MQHLQTSPNNAPHIPPPIYIAIVGFNPKAFSIGEYNIIIKTIAITNKVI